jgi:tight adherence protein B
MLPGALVMALVTAVGWVFHVPLSKMVREQTYLLPATFTALVVLCVSLAGMMWGESEGRRRRWLRRTQAAADIDSLSEPGALTRLVHRLPDPLEWLFSPLLRTNSGRRLAEDWADAGFGDRPSRYFLLLVLTVVAGWLFGSRVAGPVVGIAMAIAFPFLPRSFVSSRAAVQRRRFGEQLPQALDSLAAGLSAGLSLQQAIEFSHQELPDPVGSVLAKLWRRMILGFPAEEALRSLLLEHHEESLALVIEGIVLQRQFGGDLVRMLEETGELLRERVELEREVRAVTTQGRLSGFIIAGLMPVSAGMLLLFNPSYIDVLFETLPGQVLLVIALLLLFVGWWVISRLIRVRY